MASAKLNFEVDGKAYAVYFGMASIRVFQERAAKEFALLVASGIEDPKREDFDNVKSFANLLYSGLCNMADINDEIRPKFIDVYELAERIEKMPELAKLINDTWTESQPVQEMLDRLGTADEKKNTVLKTGKKSKHTQQVS